MSNLSNDKLMDLVDETFTWADEVSELWTGTQYEERIDLEKAQITKAIEQNDLEKVQKLVYDLAQTLDYAEEAYRKSDEH